MRPASANRKSKERSAPRSASSTPSPYSSGQPTPRPTSQPSFGQNPYTPSSHHPPHIANLDPWESAELSARLAAPTAPPPATKFANNNNPPQHGWTAFGSNSPAMTGRSSEPAPPTLMPPPRTAPGRTAPGPPPSGNQNHLSYVNNNGYYKQNSNLPVSSTLISPALSPAGTPTHQQKSWTSSGYGEGSTSVSPATSPLRSNQPSCQALYDFEAENGNELSFKEGDVIVLKTKLDENWFEGSLNGKTGCFPINYVNVIVNLP